MTLSISTPASDEPARATPGSRLIDLRNTNETGADVPQATDRECFQLL